VPWAFAPGRVLSLDRPRILAILNVTPDSFADGGQLPTPDSAADAAERAVADGADALDIGGESTRPGAAAVGEAEQIRRVVPAIRAIRARGVGVPITVDTTKAPVAAAALDAGADAINDVSAGTDDPAMLPLAGQRRCGLILMHRLAPPRLDRYSDQYARASAPDYPGGVVESVRRFLVDRAHAAAAAGVDPAGMLLDPGLGFGKTVEQNLELLSATPTLARLGFGIVSALSRKSFVGRVALARDSTPTERLPGTLGLSAMHLAAGARVFRVHDVAPHAQALAAAWAVLGRHAVPVLGPPGINPPFHA
jgi:dihydropteroate synthase